jgi:hypothetical protein
MRDERIGPRGRHGMDNCEIYRMCSEFEHDDLKIAVGK